MSAPRTAVADSTVLTPNASEIPALSRIPDGIESIVGFWVARIVTIITDRDFLTSCET